MGAKMEKIEGALKAADRIIMKSLKAITITSFLLLTLLISANVFIRFVPIASLHWFDEIIELLYAYLVFYGSAALWISREHFGVGDWLEKRIDNPRIRTVYQISTGLLVMGFVLIFFYFSLKLTLMAQDVTNVFAIPKKILYSCLPISGAVMIIYSIRDIAFAISAMKTPEPR